MKKLSCTCETGSCILHPPGTRGGPVQQLPTPRLDSIDDSLTGEMGARSAPEMEAIADEPFPKTGPRRRRAQPAEARAIVLEGQTTDVTPEDPAAPAVGKWYWIAEKVEHELEERPYVFSGNIGEEDDADAIDPKEKYRKDNRWLGCVTKIGSNFVALKGVFGQSTRVHLNDFYDQCELEADADAVLATRMEESKSEVFALMHKVKDITSKLAITPGRVLMAGQQEAQALAVYGTGRNVDEYKAALVRAEESELPELFKQIKAANQKVERWMSAKLIPLEAQAQSLTPAIGAVKKRIFSVKLYAGLVEDIKQVRDGEPAPLNEPLHVVQRRAYMDEECLANYEAGGMDWRNIRDFDRWLGRQENLNRIMPFQRCIIAFRVRRHMKDRGRAVDLAMFWRMKQEEKYDKLTFLYIRNGDKLFRLETDIEFDEKLFPDLDAQKLNTGTPYAKVTADTVERVISEHQYRGWCERVRQHERENEEARKAWEAEQAAKPKKDRDPFFHEPHRIDHFDAPRWYAPFTPENVHYDEIARFIGDEVDKHNRLVLVLQGLLDRSPCLHPHPPWSLWNPQDFEKGLRLIYDNDRALTPGDAPDFKAYFNKLAATITEGSVTIGQERVWMKREADKEAERAAARGGRFDRDYYRPYDDPGPGALSVVSYIDRSGRAVFEWIKPKKDFDERSRDTLKELRIRASRLFNVSAYKPGDFKPFFADPRTRAEYLQWAPLLLVAEDYHAGKRQSHKPPTGKNRPKPKPRISSPESQFRRQRAAERAERRKRFLHAAVELERDVSLMGGDKLKAGWLFRVTDANRDGTFHIVAINKDGTRVDAEKRKGCRNIGHHDLLLRPDIAPDPYYAEQEQKLKEYREKLRREQAEVRAKREQEEEEDNAS